MSERGVAEQRADRCQTRVAGADAVGALVLEVIEERADQRRVEIADVQLPGRLGAALGGEGKQQAHCVAVGGDRVLAGVALFGQAVGEERLHRWGQGAHERFSVWRTSRSAASCMSSGAADRYQ